MNTEKACNILQLPIKFDIDLLKQQYRFNALRHHPDKNKDSPESTIRFQEINEAYSYLLKKHQRDDYINDYEDNDSFHSDDEFDIYFSNDTDCHYNSVLFHYLKHYLKNPLLVAIINRLADICESKALDLLSNIDKVLLLKIYEFMKQYKPIFYFSEDFFEKFQDIVKSKMDNDECIIIHPLLDDLLDKNLYKMKIDHNTFIIPLWHHELVYDHSGNDIIFKCYPILPNHVSIDSDNNLHVNVSYTIHQLMDVESVDVDIGINKISIPTNKLLFSTKQMVLIRNNGVPRINYSDIYDVSRCADIYCNITIVMPSDVAETT